LLGHAWEMAAASGVGFRFEWESIPFVSGAYKYAADFIFPGGASDNKLYFDPHVKFLKDLRDESQLLLYDPQTSGGLLMAVPKNKLGAMLIKADQIGQSMWVVGEVFEGNHIQVV